MLLPVTRVSSGNDFGLPALHYMRVYLHTCKWSHPRVRLGKTDMYLLVMLLLARQGSTC